jgi:choice-of-anchor B domain-containing protein
MDHRVLRQRAAMLSALLFILGAAGGTPEQGRAAVVSPGAQTASPLPPDGFSIRCEPAGLTAWPARSASAACVVSPAGAFRGLVELDCQQLRAGEACDFRPSLVEVTPDGSAESTFELSLPPSTVPGDYLFVVRGRSGSLEHGVNVDLHVVSGGFPCENGRAGEYSCQDVDLVANFPLAAIGGVEGKGSGGWGWSDPETGREYAIVGHSSGVAFVDVTDPEEMTYVGLLLPNQGELVVGDRHLGVFRNHLYVVGSDFYTGLQIFDLTRLRSVERPPVTFTEDAHYGGFDHADAIEIDEETGTAFVVNPVAGACSGLEMLSLQSPTQPLSVGCFDDRPGRDRTVDAQCVVYRGADLAHRGREVCFAPRQEWVSLVDVQDKASPQLITRLTYPDVGYINQGRLTEDHRYYLQGDGSGHTATSRRYIWDVADLAEPRIIGYYEPATPALDNGLWIRGNEAYQASFQAGFRMLSLSRVASGQLEEVAWFDTAPLDDGRQFSGAYSVYPFHRNGLVTVSDTQRGLFVLRPTGCRAPATPGLEAPPDGATGVASSSSLDWSEVAEATAYDIELATDPVFDHVVRSASGLAASAWTVTPGLEGSTTFWWRARAASGCASGSWSPGASFTTAANRPPVLDPIGGRFAYEGSTLSFTVHASDPDGDPLSYTASALPAGATFDPSTRTFAWTPDFTQAGSYPGLTFEVSDGRGGTDSEAITITVINTNRPPVADAGPDQTVPVATVVTLDGTGSSDPDGDPLTYAWSQFSGLPVTIADPSVPRATVSGARAGTYVFELVVSDGGFQLDVVRDRVTVTVTGATAVYDPALQVPSCGTVADSCDSGSLLVGRDSITGSQGLGPEPHQPNTISASCADGTSGTFHVDESIDRVRVSTLDGRGFASGALVKVDVTVWAWAANPAADKLELYYASSASAPVWNHITTLTPSAGGSQTLSATYLLPLGDLQAVRARFRYGGAKAPCQTGAFDDHDDLAFAVDRSAAVFDPLLKAPRCWAIGGLCDSGTLLVGRDGVGPEPNQPNTINDSCADGTSGVFHVDESNDRIQVSTLDGGPLAPGKIVKVEATVWDHNRSRDLRDRLDLFYAANANNPSWVPIKSLISPGPGLQKLSAVYRLPEGRLQAVRARFYNSVIPGACVVGSLDDHDDLVFAVGVASPLNSAVFDPVLKVPRCGEVGSACDSGTLLVGRDGKGPEPNQPNTILGSCADGTAGAFHVDESVDSMRVSTLDGGNFAPGKPVKIEATVWAWNSSPSTDKLDLYYAADAAKPSWTYITTLTPSVGGAQLLSATYTLPVGELQAVRARFRYGGVQVACGDGAYDDEDDVVFAVDQTTAVFDPALKAPGCAGVASACDSGVLLVGRDGVATGPEPNEPNTLFGACPDGRLGSGYYGVDERPANDYIRVSTLDGADFAPGKPVKIEVVVRPFLELGVVQQTLELYAAPDAGNPAWTRIASLSPINAWGAELLTTGYVLPSGELQAVRARFRRRNGNTQGPCTGQYSEHSDDHDDLVFAVRPPPPAEP